MTTYTLWPEASPDGGMVRCQDSLYADARAGMGILTSYTVGLEGQIGQHYQGDPYFIHSVYQSLLAFDGGVPVGEVIVAADLHMLFPSWHTTPIADAFTVEVRCFDFPAIGGAAFIDGDELGTYDLAASIASGDIVFDAFNILPITAAGLAVMNAGTFRFNLSSSRQRVGNEPTASEYVSMRCRGYEDENTAGEWAYLVVTTAAGGTLLINGGATVVFDPDVTLTLNSGEQAANSYRLSNDGGATWSARYAYATSEAWTLAAGGTGPREVTVEYSTELAGD